LIIFHIYIISSLYWLAFILPLLIHAILSLFLFHFIDYYYYFNITLLITDYFIDFLTFHYWYFTLAISPRFRRFQPPPPPRHASLILSFVISDYCSFFFFYFITSIDYFRLWLIFLLHISFHCWYYCFHFILILMPYFLIIVTFLSFIDAITLYFHISSPFHWLLSASFSRH